MADYIKDIRAVLGNQRIILVGAAVFIHKDGKLLMQKRLDNGFWMGTSGGYMELGETVEETAKRELLEETGLTANSLELLGIMSGKDTFYTYPNGDMVAVVDAVYLCEDFSGEMAAQTDEVAELQWFDINNMPDNINPPSSSGLKKCLEVLRNRR